MDRAELRASLRAGAMRLAAQVAQRPRPERAAARALLLAAWRALELGAPEVELRALVRQVEDALRVQPLVDAAATCVPVWQMRSLKPWPEVVRRTLAGDRALDWQAAWELRWRPRMALCARRLQWFEARLRAAPDGRGVLPGALPGATDPARAPTGVLPGQGAGAREPLELLYKRGRSRFS